jgi:hypothetical protein
MSYINELPRSGRTASYGADDKPPAFADDKSVHEVDVTVTEVDQAFEDLVKEEEDHDVSLHECAGRRPRCVCASVPGRGLDVVEPECPGDLASPRHVPPSSPLRSHRSSCAR